MKTHVIPWMSKEETEHLLKEIYGRPVSAREMEIGAKPEAAAPEAPAPADSSDATTLKIASL